MRDVERELEGLAPNRACEMPAAIAGALRQRRRRRAAAKAVAAGCCAALLVGFAWMALRPAEKPPGLADRAASVDPGSNGADDTGMAFSVAGLRRLNPDMDVDRLTLPAPAVLGGSSTPQVAWAWRQGGHGASILP